MKVVVESETYSPVAAGELQNVDVLCSVQGCVYDVYGIPTISALAKPAHSKAAVLGDRP
jgi:hypothetical protein